MSTWVGTRVRKGEEEGIVTRDDNGYMRVLTITMKNRTKEVIRMNNIGEDPNPEELHKWEWFYTVDDVEIWYRF